jgi:hypothetical protein
MIYSSNVNLTVPLHTVDPEQYGVLCPLCVFRKIAAEMVMALWDWSFRKPRPRAAEFIGWGNAARMRASMVGYAWYTQNGEGTLMVSIVMPTLNNLGNVVGHSPKPPSVATMGEGKHSVCQGG